jgi:hypothetical protein
MKVILLHLFPSFLGEFSCAVFGTFSVNFQLTLLPIMILSGVSPIFMTFLILDFKDMIF